METRFSSLSVLIVDDDDYQRRFLARMLAAIGVQDIKQAESAASAVEITVAMGDELHVIISDLDMPDIDGIEFLRLLSDHNVNAGVLIVSGKDASILRSVGLMAIEYGVKLLGTIPKPVKISELRDVLTAYQCRVEKALCGADMVVCPEDILHGLEHGQFEPFFQPKVDIHSRCICGAEALARWRHPERGVLSPSVFIGVAERHGLIDQLTWVVLEKAMLQLRQWISMGLDIPVSVNFSQSSLVDTRLPNKLSDLMFRCGVKPEHLIVEVTETTAVTDLAHSLETLSRLRMRGFGLSIDDFGTGHSSLQQLARVPYTELKIDQTFVNGLSRQPHLLAVVESSVAMAKKLGLKSVAEGIESLEDWLCLQQLGCEIGQGYYIAKPMAAEKVFDWTREWQSNRESGKG